MDKLSMMDVKEAYEKYHPAINSEYRRFGIPELDLAYFQTLTQTIPLESQVMMSNSMDQKIIVHCQVAKYYELSYNYYPVGFVKDLNLKSEDDTPENKRQLCCC